MVRITITRKTILISVGVGLVLFIGGIAFVFESSTSPEFCKACHIMQPYYDSWKASKHNKTGCVDCHYPPSNMKTLLWKKFQASAEIVKYVTRTYQPRPHAEVEDASCLREGCHTKRVIDGKLTFGKGIKFDHGPHLTEPKRGKHLRCTSCHSQIMIGKHLDVTLDTCYLCHFKGMKTDRDVKPLGGCTACHEIPEKDFTIGNVKYNHRDYAAKHGVECQDCHLDSIQGDGAISKDRCLTCHNQPERLEKYDDMAFIHDNHITKHGVACFRCHDEMTHSIKTVMKVGQPDCALCHVDTHSSQKDMYEGRGARGVPEMPSSMSLSRVGCQSCHIDGKKDKGEEASVFKGMVYKASPEACVTCHDEKYASLLDPWRAELDSALKAIEARLKEAKDAMAEVPADKPGLQGLKEVYMRAEHDYDFVRTSTGIHNIYYSARVLEKANADLEKLIKAAGKEISAGGKESLLDGSYCATLCHAKLDVQIPEEVKYKGKDMPHAMHVEEAGPCGSCHEIGRHKEIPLKTDLSVCKNCHEEGI